MPTRRRPDAVVLPLDDLPVGVAVSVACGDRRITVVRCGPDEVRALDGDCTHAAGPTAQGTVDGCLLACPWHGAVFDVRTGEVHRGPARKPLATYPTRVEDGWAVVVLSAQDETVDGEPEVARG
ncbi:MAG: Rieske (2Fe-2S) protein [Actinobacteria bacterium]|nr:Rieske (2Fe-2S) protein [Actinomycetota bacterium]